MRFAGWQATALLLVIAGTCDLAFADSVTGQAGSSDPGREIVSLRLGQTPERTRLVFDLSAAPDFQWRVGNDGQDLELVLAGTRWAASAPERLFSGSAVMGLEKEPVTQSGDLRLILAFSAAQRLDVFPLEPHASRGHRLVVDAYPSGSDGASASAQVAEDSSDPARLGLALAAAPSVSPDAAASAGDQPLSSGSPVSSQRAASAGSRAALSVGSASDSWLSGLRTSGYAEFTSAYTVSGPSRWSLLRARIEPAVTGNLGSSLRFKLAGRAQGDAAFDLEDHYYPDAVRDDQRSHFSIREAYVDADAGDWQFRLGRQHVVWGEMVGLFLADVVSARDMREFYLQEFDAMRIPQWGVRAERFAGDSHLELLWIPHPSYDEIGEPGADFYPFPVPAGVPVRNDRPERNLGNSHWGLRGSHLVAGWDLSAFYYQSQDVAPTLFSTPTGLELRNERLKQLGATFSKDFYTWVLRGEAVHTAGRHFYSAAPGSAASFMPEASESIDYVLGVTVPRGDWRFDLQFYGRHLFQYDQNMLGDANEVGVTALVNYGFGQRFEWEVLYLSGLNRTDWSLQPRMVYNVTPEWRLQVGADLFGGEPIGLFGQFDESDRVYLELRRWF